MIRRLLERWRFLPPRELVAPPATGPEVLELVPVYPNGAYGALVRLELARLRDANLTDDVRVMVPPGAVGFELAVRRRAGIYAGESLTVERPSEPPPAFLRGRP